MTDPYLITNDKPVPGLPHAKDGDLTSQTGAAQTKAKDYGLDYDKTPEFWIFIGKVALQSNLGRCLHCAGAAALLALSQGCTDKMTVYGTGGHHMLGIGDYVIDVWLHNQKEFAEQLEKLQVRTWPKERPRPKFPSIAGSHYWTSDEYSLTYGAGKDDDGRLSFEVARMAYRHRQAPGEGRTAEGHCLSNVLESVERRQWCHPSLCGCPSQQRSNSRTCRRV